MTAEPALPASASLPPTLSEAAPLPEWMRTETIVPQAQGPGPQAVLPPFPFRILGPLGQGGMGVVYRAHDPGLDRPLAVKVLRDPDQAGRFVTEARITGRLQHPGVVAVHQLGTLPDGRPYLAMKLIDGRDLAHLLAGRPSPRHDLPRFLKIFEQAAQAVAYAHRQGVIHRDLKPGNIMVGAFGEVQVMDWGLAKVVAAPPPGPAAPQTAVEADPTALTFPAAPAAGDTARPGGDPTLTLDSTPAADAGMTVAGTVLGTPAYMPPEQARGETAGLDARADVFSLGAILCEILTGRPPFGGATAAAVVAQAAQGDLAEAAGRLDGCGADAELVALAQACLAADAADRPADGLAVAEAVAAYQAGVQERLRAAEVDRAAAEARAAGERRVRRWVVAAAAVALAGAAVASGLAGWALTEKTRADEQTGVAEANATRAREQTARAEGNLAAARRAVDECFLVAKDHPLFRGEAHQPRRELLLKAALPFYRQFQAQAGDDPAILATQADTLGKVAHIVTAMGDPAAGLAAYAEARDLYARLAADHPGEPRYRYDLACVWNDLGMAQRSNGRGADADRSYAAAAALFTRLAADAPDEPRYRADLARALYNRGNVQAAAGQAAEAAGSYQAAVDLLTRLTADHPADRSFRESLGAAWTNLGAQHRAAGRWAEAERYYEAGRALLAQLAADYPTATEYRADLATAWIHLGSLQQDTGRAAAAADSFKAARHLLAPLAANFPAVPRYQADLAHVWNHIGLLQKQTGQPAEAERSHQRAQQLLTRLTADYPDVPGYQGDLAATWSNLGTAQQGLGRATEAEQSFRTAQELLTRLAAAHPTVTQYRANLAAAWTNQGNLTSRQGRQAEALACYGQAQKVLDELLAANARDATARLYARNTQAGRASALALQGRFAEAVAAWDRALAFNDQPQAERAIRRARAALVVPSGLMQDFAWPLLWGWPR